MNALLDTRALIWWLDDDPRLSAGARRVIASRGTTVYVSSASAWEMATKVRLGKLKDAGGAVPRLLDILEERGLTELAITVRHAVEAGSLPGPHRDPFDRMLMAQSRVEKMPVVTDDPVFREYGIETIW